jgi:phosphate acetyltransferase
MKGSLHTDELMREVTAGKTGLHTARRISRLYHGCADLCRDALYH